MKDAVDYLEELIDNEENADFMNQVDAVYIEPPEDEGNVSGEDDAEENEGGKVDDICGNQLKAGCELVLRNGDHIDSLDFQETEEDQNVEYVVLDVINESQYNLSHDQPSQIIQQEPMDASSEEGVAEGGTMEADVPIETIVLPWVDRLRRVQSRAPNIPLPDANKDSTFTWVNDPESAAIPVFPEPNFDDCRNVEPHVLFERFFDDELLQHICDCSARYALLNLQKEITFTVQGKFI